MQQEQIARRALEAYSINSPHITFIRHNETITFHVIDQQTGNGYLLRIHSPLTIAFQGERLQREGIISELLWLEALADQTPIILQRPVRTHNGASVTIVTEMQEEIVCSLLTWIEAAPFPTIPSLEQATQLGTIVATLHNHARRWTIPNIFTRPIYDLAFYQQQINSLGKGISNDIIKEEDFVIVQETLKQVLILLATLQEPLLLIHADLHRGNLLVSETNVHPIDFSLCGFGSPLFDLGTCLSGIPIHLRSIFLEAYQQKETLPSGFPRLLDAFFLISRMGAYVYLLANPKEHNWLKERIPRFTRQECQMFLEEKPLLFGGSF